MQPEAGESRTGMDPIQGAGARLLPYPPPCRAWLAISNDPDNTTWENWRELHALIWEELGLPFADSFFLVNHNEHLPNQVTLENHPEILRLHPHDTMHTWGDFCFSRRQRFAREDARRGLERLRELGAAPCVWTDHCDFSGNLFLAAGSGALPALTDKAGHAYENFAYSLDLAVAAGVRYVWDGGFEDLPLGQDRPLSRREWYAHVTGRPDRALLLAAADRAFGPLLRRIESRKFSYDPLGNRPYREHLFPDGERLHCFRRYGRGRFADIDGFGELFSPAETDRLIATGGTSIVYAHLGKRKAVRDGEAAHIPPATREAFVHLAEKYRAGELMLSSTSRLLDYLVLRDHARVEKNRLTFRADGVRFHKLTESDLAGFSFGIIFPAAGQLEIYCESAPARAGLQHHGSHLCEIHF